MIGFQTDKQKRLFYSFDLEDHVPQNHLLRANMHAHSVCGWPT
jgi:hypothetical protein